MTTYTYDPAGNQLTTEDPNGVTATDTYTPLDQVATVSYSDSTPDVSYTYDADGNRTAMTDASGTSSYTYDPFGELTSRRPTAPAKTVVLQLRRPGRHDLDHLSARSGRDLGQHRHRLLRLRPRLRAHLGDRLQRATPRSSPTRPMVCRPPSSLGASGRHCRIHHLCGQRRPRRSRSDPTARHAARVRLLRRPSGAIAAETDTPSSSLSPADYAYDAQSRVTQMTPGIDQRPYLRRGRQLEPDHAAHRGERHL